jgi:anti-sigma regulatory factor (Ser/Thr protein kinase)
MSMVERVTHDRGASAREVLRATASGFDHRALFYAGDDEFLAGTMPFVKRALDAGEAVLVALTANRCALLRSQLGEQAKQVGFLDMAKAGRNPARIIPLWRDFVDSHASSGRSVSGVGEPIWCTRSEAELDECQRHETLLNLAFASGPPWHLLCPYDAERLDKRVLGAARCSHPILVEGCKDCPSELYRDPHPGLEVFSGELPAPECRTQQLSFTAAQLKALRASVRAHAAEVGMTKLRREDFVISVNELATNSVCYGGGKGQLWLWREGQTLVCEVRSAGHIDRPLLGREAPSINQAGGRGLWIVNQLCDLVQVRNHRGESVVRVRMSAAGPEADLTS